MEHGRRVVGRDDDGEPLARVPVPARVTGRDAAERLGELRQEPPCTADQEAVRRPRLVGAGKGGQELRLLLRADPRHLLEPSGCGRLAQLGRVADAERLRDQHRLLRPDSEVAPEADEVGLHFALELLQLGDLAGLDELLQPRLDARPDPAELATRPARTRSATGALVDRISSAARR